MENNGKIEIEKFNSQSFELWKLKMEDLLVDKDQWIAIYLGTKPTGVSDEEWKKLDLKEKSTICGGPQYCSNNATTPGTPFFNFINPVVRNKLGSDGAVCTSTSSCRSCHLVSWHKSARGSSQLL